MIQGTQDNKNIDLSLPQKLSLKQLAEYVFQETTNIYQDKNKFNNQTLQSGICMIRMGENSLRIFGRVHSLEELKKQSDFFMEQTCLMMRHILLQIQRLIENKAFSNQDMLSFLKTIAFKQLGKDLWQLQYLPQFEQILDYQIDQNIPPTKKSQDAFVTLWIQAREFSSEISKEIQNQIDQNLKNGGSLNTNIKFVCARIQANIFEKSIIQLQSEMGKSQLEIKRTCQQSKIEIVDVSGTNIQNRSQIQLNYEQKIARVKQNQQICLIPDGKIFSGVFSQQNHLSLSRRTEFREINKPLLSQTQQFVQIHYIGELNLNLIPHGQGQLVTKNNNFTITYIGGFKDGCFNGDGAEYRNGKLSFKGKYVNNYKNGQGCIAINDKYHIKGIFLCDRKNGIFEEVHINKDEQIIVNKQIVYYFELNRQLDQNNPQDKLIIAKFLKQNNRQIVLENPPYQILQINKISLNNLQLISLNPGKWLNSSIIDAFINIQQKFQLLKNNNKNQNPYLILNVADCEDIFSSVITPINELNYKEFEKIYGIQQNRIQCKQFQRILFIFNYDQSHFLLFQYEYETLYQIDSMDCDRSVLYNLIVKLLIEFKYKVTNYIRLPVSQQSNIYDCGSYASFYAMQLLRYQHLTQKEQFDYLQVDEGVISSFRQHIISVLYHSNGSIYPKN